MRKTETSLPWMWAGVFFNIAVLCLFKYFNFFSSTSSVFFPLGISFYTFQFISTLVETHKGKSEMISFLDFILSVSFFPKLIQGPICDSYYLSSQFRNSDCSIVNWESISKGLFLFSIGLFKKVLIADKFAEIANTGFSSIPTLNTVTAFLSVLSYSLQIYFDFSGYSDMAIGIGYMFNVRLPVNFDSPYKAHSISDFWKRWHITLTKFLTKYVYIPLGGNRKGEVRTYLNILIVFIISGIWHGVGITFLIWGAMHGIAMIIERKLGPILDRIPGFIRWLFTLVFVGFSWIFFRADSVADALLMVKKILSFEKSGVGVFFSAISIKSISFFVQSLPAKKLLNYIIVFLIPICIILFCKNSNQLTDSFKPSVKNSIITALLLCSSVISFSGIVTFVYAFF
jgi:D-alanyl-lipoteichoic acid acyltransferase DltB (MBOAT superfamily)